METIKLISDIAILLFAVAGFSMSIGLVILICLVKRGAVITFSYDNSEEDPDE